MDPIEVSVLVLAVTTNLALLGFVYLRNPRSATHRLFSLLVLVMSLWSITNFFAVNATTQPAATWLVRGVMFFATPMSVIFFLLMHTFPRSTLSLSPGVFWVWVVLTGATMATALSPFLFTTVEVIPDSAPKPTPGPGMALFVPVAIGTIPLGIYYLVRKTIRAQGLTRTQMQFLLLGVAVMFALIIALNFISVVVFGTSAFNKFGPLFTLPLTVLAAYAIVRHRFLDIRAVIMRALGFSVLAGGFFIAYGVLVYVLTAYLGKFSLSPLQHALVAITALALAIPSYHYFRRGLQKLTDRFLFQNRVDYRQALVDIGEALARTIEIKEVTATILNALKEIVRCRKAAILLHTGSDGGIFVPSAHFGMEHFNVTIPRDNELIKHLQHTTGPVVSDELAILKERETSRLHIKEIETIEHNLDWLDASVVVPLFVNQQLTGVLLLGEKLSGQPYLQEDIEFLAALAPQAATALENARLYEEARQFSKKLQEEVERATHDLAIANKQLKDLDRAKSEFLSIASHQLYTPLTALRGYLSMIQEGDFGNIPVQQQPIISILEQSSARLITLIRNLLDISRIESGRLELNLETVDLGKLAADLVRELLPNAQDKNLALALRQPEGRIPSVIADRERLRQVVLNFIDNALKYTDTGRIDVTVQQDGDDVVCSVTDTGRGMTAKEIQQIFTKFTRVGEDARTRPEGTGLGLYFAKQIAREHHGDATADSPGHGKGATFSLRLPAAGTPHSLKLGEKTTVEIKAAESKEKVSATK